MAHSSGGGSHSGGGHSGSSGGGSHSGGSSHRGGGGSGTPLYSETNFEGAKRYVYYKNHAPHYFYSAVDPAKKRSPFRFIMVLFYIPFLFAIFSIVFSFGIQFPKKIPMAASSEIRIEDNLDIINDDELLPVLIAFQENTGVTPMIYTGYNSEWQEHYDDLEAFAYDKYVNSFTDEQHWLIVYTEPEETNKAFSDWYWEGMQGDDTDASLTSRSLGVFNETLQKNLTASNFYTTTEAFVSAFEALNEYANKVHIEPEPLMMGAFMFLFILFHAYLTIFFRPGYKREYAKAKLVEEKSKEIKCDYCDGVYISGTVTSCPHCGAPVKIDR